MFANSNSKKGQVDRACPPALLPGLRDPSRGSDQAHRPETNTCPGSAHPELCSLPTRGAGCPLQRAALRPQRGLSGAAGGQLLPLRGPHLRSPWPPSLGPPSTWSWCREPLSAEADTRPTWLSLLSRT